MQLGNIVVIALFMSKIEVESYSFRSNITIKLRFCIKWYKT